MRMQIDQARDHIKSAGIDYVASLFHRDGAFDRRDLSIQDGDVGACLVASRRIANVAILDDDVVESFPSLAHGNRTSGRCRHKIASSQHS